MALDHSCQVQRHPHADRGLDLYETPPVAVEALLRVEKIPQTVWEPAAGRGAIVRVLRDHRHTVVTSDIVARNFPLKIIEPFVARALALCPRVIVLARLAFMESERRCGILENCGLARVHVFRERLPMMHRDDWTGRRGNSGMAFAWFCWDRDHVGPATIDRLSWKPKPAPSGEVD
jgi:hypothetical protein